jgi:hypothetical protein
MPSREVVSVDKSLGVCVAAAMLFAIVTTSGPQGL